MATMKFLLKKMRELKAAGLYGQAMAVFHQKKYDESMQLLEKVCKLDPDNPRKEIYYSYLGRCYLALGKGKAALKLFSEAYEPFIKRFEHPQNEETDFSKQEYIYFLNAYLNVLESAGQVELVAKVGEKLREVSLPSKEG